MPAAADLVEMSHGPPRPPMSTPGARSPASMPSSSAHMGTSATRFNEDERRRAGPCESPADDGDEGEGWTDVVGRGSGGERQRAANL
jgi:hypothetical protein